MNLKLRDALAERWARFFPGAEPPFTFFYADDPGDAEPVAPAPGHRCIFVDFNRVRHGADLALRNESVACFGGRRYLGFAREIRPDFEYFLSCGIPGKLEGERYKQTPQMVRDWMAQMPAFVAPRPWIVFKRWDRLTEQDAPEVVVFYATPDVLSGLFTLANFDETGNDGVVTPMASGCGALVMHPYLQGREAHPRAVLGLFDPSARPYAAPDVLSFAVPIAKFERMAANMEESFLITGTWKHLQARVARRRTAE